MFKKRAGKYLNRLYFDHHWG